MSRRAAMLRWCATVGREDIARRKRADPGEMEMVQLCDHFAGVLESRPDDEVGEMFSGLMHALAGNEYAEHLLKQTTEKAEATL